MDAATDGTLSYEILTPTGRIAQGACDTLVAPAVEGAVGILPHHAPYLAALGTGVLRFKRGGDETRVFVSGGFIEVLENRVIVLAELAESGTAIDVERARKALARSEARLALGAGPATAGEATDRLRARRAADRAKARLKAAGQIPA